MKLGLPHFAILAIILAAAPLASAQITDSSAFEHYLIPLFLPAASPQAGAYGSAWETDLSIRNEGDEPAVIFQNACLYECRPPIPTTGCEAGEPTAAHAAFTGRLDPNDNVGRIPAIFLHVEKDRDDQVAIELRLVERSRGVVESGVEIPVVRERDFRDTSTWLVNVPNQPASRAHLRVYFLSSPSMQGQVRVRIYPGDADTATSDEILTGIPADDAGGVPLPGEMCAGAPSYAILYLSDRMTDLPSTVRVRIDPITPELRFWPMISITSNESQYVTLVTAQ